MKKHNLIYLLSAILVIGFLATSFISFFVTKSSIRSAVFANELPLTTDNIYSEIQKDLLIPVFVSKMMAKDRFLRDWVMAGERNEAQVLRYLHDIQVNNKAFVSYFVSDVTHKYYYGDGKTRVISESDSADGWYFRFRASKLEYVLNLDTDKVTPDVYVIYVDHKMVDDAGKFIGIAGNGIALDYLKKLMTNYQSRYLRNVYFVDAEGVVKLSDNKTKLLGSDIKLMMGDANFKRMLAREKKPETEFKDDYEYQYNGTNFLMNLRYIPELKWYLVVEKDEAEGMALNENKKTLYVNLALCAAITALALLLTQGAIKRYQAQIEQLATTDKLTGLANRTAFEVAVAGMLGDSKRNKTPISIVLFDLDDFKKINDTYGHNAGDLVLKEMACGLYGHVRQADFFCRWGGEEFLVLLKDCDSENAEKIAENYREIIANQTVAYETHQIKVTCSFGVATLHDNEDVEQLISRADMCLYKAKANGRNQVVVDNT